MLCLETPASAEGFYRDASVPATEETPTPSDALAKAEADRKQAVAEREAAQAERDLARAQREREEAATS